MPAIPPSVWYVVGFALGLVVIIVLSGLALADAISTELAAAATTGAGFLTLVMLFAAVKSFGGK